MVLYTLTYKLLNIHLLELLIMAENLKKICFNIDKETKKEVDIIAKFKETTATALYNKWIKEGIKKEGVNIKVESE